MSDHHRRGAGVLCCLMLALLPACSRSHHPSAPSVAASDLGDIIGEDFVGTAAETLNGRARTSPARFQFNYLDVYGTEMVVDIAGVWNSDSLGFGTVTAYDPSAMPGINFHSTNFLMDMFHAASCGDTYLSGAGTFGADYRRFEGTYSGVFCGDTLRAHFSTSR